MATLPSGVRRRIIRRVRGLSVDRAVSFSVHSTTRVTLVAPLADVEVLVVTVTVGLVATDWDFDRTDCTTKRSRQRSSNIRTTAASVPPCAALSFSQSAARTFITRFMGRFALFA